MATIRDIVTKLHATACPSPNQAARMKIEVPSAAEEPIVLSNIDQFLFEAFGKDSAIIPAGVAMTAIILTSGLLSLKNNNKAQQQLFMRMRVGAQGATVLAMMASLAVQERQKSLEVKSAQLPQIPTYLPGSCCDEEQDWRSTVK